MGQQPFGLCDRCTHQRLVHSGRGSVFSLCRLSASDPRFPKYPRMPVLECVGFERRPDEAVGGRRDAAVERRSDERGPAAGE